MSALDYIDPDGDDDGSQEAEEAYDEHMAIRRIADRELLQALTATNDLRDLEVKVFPEWLVWVSTRRPLSPRMRAWAERTAARIHLRF